ncbi:cysteine desulfurase [Rarobacter faecitabidus]|uniref:cysteine desulfurase n=1 Tax=Rarobacter faecitabidus TaxID=13243 RepID=A0A542ZVF6_RARFA|nr:SufS family cysteine desulfurase [Rarobacter faecitabidus]TQL64301.1 cysteine desulfurase [Rarobacter faecitabidus]
MSAGVETDTAAFAMSEGELERVRADFPLLARPLPGGRRVVYLDSGATSQKPDPVLDAEQDFYIMRNAAVHRGAHQLAHEATVAFEEAREHVAAFIGAPSDELVWTSGATAAINLVAYAFSNATAGRGGQAAQRFALRPGDEIVVSEAEHHSNLVPWQELAARTGAVLRWFEVDEAGRIRVDQAGEVITDRTRIVAMTQVSNVTGAITPLAPIIARAHDVGALVLVDGCQSVPHLPVDVTEIGADFLVFSAHKMLGPTGIGALWARRELLEAMPPVTTGGSMVEVVRMTETTYAPPPQRFEAGTQAVAQAVAFGTAARYLGELGMRQVAEYERQLAVRLLEVIGGIEGVRIIGPTDPADRIAVVSFVVDGVHAHDVGQYLDDHGVLVRVGHHCAQPLHRKFGIAATSRASASIYTSFEDIDALGDALGRVRSFFGVDSHA